ncbi:type II toxin-antitoxin system VapC family toxin [Acidobacteria bacterium ACD]|nr:MAG: PIN domain-containing protein [Acidobacteriota bacterium]MCE7957233.1 PIN domain-containing protein [Acidobacteria bacterium ACB2]MDL1950285.1 type II toxin-antitoxin system VapC family toxin [Acidobacteria bacterium ACD]
MIVVDTNVLAYLWVKGERTGSAKALLRADPEWWAPLLWRSEFRSVLATYVRAGWLPAAEARAIAADAEEQMAGREEIVGTEPVLELAFSSGCSAYDCEFVALARQLDVPLVTADRRVLAAFPKVARSLERATGQEEA